MKGGRQSWLCQLLPLPMLARYWESVLVYHLVAEYQIFSFSLEVEGAIYLLLDWWVRPLRLCYAQVRKLNGNFHA
jgi:hypothetical protein